MFTLISKNDSVLKQKSAPFDFKNSLWNPLTLSETLIETMQRYNGYGLSAPQVGLNVSVFVASTLPEKAFFNPKLVYTSAENIALDEVNLSYPGLILKNKRPRDIRIRYQDSSGNVQTEKFTGITARVIQQMIDHLDGHLFYEKASYFHKERAKRKGLL